MLVASLDRSICACYNARLNQSDENSAIAKQDPGPIHGSPVFAHGHATDPL